MTQDRDNSADQADPTGRLDVLAVRAADRCVSRFGLMAPEDWEALRPAVARLAAILFTEER